MAGVFKTADRLTAQLLAVSCILLPFVGLILQGKFMRFRDVREGSGQWAAEVVVGCALCCACSVLLVLVMKQGPGFVARGEGAKKLEGTGVKDWKHSGMHLLRKAWQGARPWEPAAPPGGLRGGAAGGRRCDMCDAAKPERAHHCAACGRCVLRMDHHCPLFAGCVGLLNHAFFAGWLLSSSLLFAFGAWSAWPAFGVCALRGLALGVDSLSPAEVSRCVGVGLWGPAAFPLALGLAMSAGGMALWHAALILTGTTTVELFRFRLAPLVAGQGLGPARYDRGWRENMREVLWPRETAHYAFCEGAGGGVKRD